MAPVPLWARAVLAIDQLAAWAPRLTRVLCQELLLAGLDDDAIQAVNSWIYGSQRTYVAGGQAFERGLFHWEEEAIGHPTFPPNGRLLIGAAGGGRELVALCRRGYQVVAFEPAERLYVEAKRAAAPFASARVIRASYAQFVAAVRQQPRGFAGAIDGPFDAVIIGWTGFSYLHSHMEALDLLATIRNLAPPAPVLLSYLGPDFIPLSRHSMVTDTIRTVLKGARRRSRHEITLGRSSGFVRTYSEDEIRALSSEAGYSVVYHRTQPFHHALLCPQATEGC